MPRRSSYSKYDIFNEEEISQHEKEMKKILKRIEKLKHVKESIDTYDEDPPTYEKAISPKHVWNLEEERDETGEEVHTKTMKEKENEKLWTKRVNISQIKEAQPKEIASPKSQSTTPRHRPSSASSAVHRSRYFEEKEMKEYEQKLIEERQRKSLERALKANPPERILQLEEQKRQERERKIKAKEEELANYNREHQFRARDPPKEIYDAEVVEEVSKQFRNQEKERKERIMKQSMELLKESRLPRRMEENGLLYTKRRKSSAQDRPSPRHHARDPPDFERLHREWEDTLQTAKKRNQPTTPVEFNCTSTQHLEELKRKFEQKRLEREQKEQQTTRKEKGLKTGYFKPKIYAEPKQTKSHILRVKILQEKVERERKVLESLILQDQARVEQIKKISKLVKAETIESEKKRKEEYGGNYVELKAVGRLATEKAKEMKKNFQEAVKRNKENIERAVMSRPSLLQRFEIDKQIAEQKEKKLKLAATGMYQTKSQEEKRKSRNEREYIIEEEEPTRKIESDCTSTDANKEKAIEQVCD